MVDPLDGKDWHVAHGDCIQEMARMPRESIDLAVYSPPFPAVYAYSDSHADLGNSEGDAEARLHFSFFFKAILPVIKPGRAMVVHCTQIPRLKRSGEVGLHDFRGTLIRLAQRAGFVYEYDWMVRCGPQSQAIRTRSRELQFAGLERDRARSRGALCMYLLKFRDPGENTVPVDDKGSLSRNDWIDWAEGCWSDIKETDTLNVADARDEKDTRHICPLQLQIYERIIRLYTNPSEVVLDPFAGIGSCGFVALGGTSPTTGRRILDPRRFYGIEMKDSYYQVALKNCRRAVDQAASSSKTLFDAIA